jgi:hypothetical protein
MGARIFLNPHLDGRKNEITFGNAFKRSSKLELYFDHLSLISINILYVGRHILIGSLNLYVRRNVRIYIK